MGNIVGRVRYRLSRPFREYNLEERAFKAVNRNKEVASPRHPSTTSHIEKIIKNLNPKIKEQLETTNPKFDSRLRQVFVTSKDVTPIEPVSKGNPDRPLPLNRSPVQPAEYGYRDPKVVPYGKVRLKDVLDFLTKHTTSPEKHNAAHIANTYKLDEQLTGHVLKYFGVFRMMVPAETTEKQAELLKRLNATADYIPNTTQLQRTLQGVPVLGKPVLGDTDGRLPVGQVKEPEVDKSQDFTLLNWRIKDPLEGGRKKGDDYFEDETHIASPSSQEKVEVIKGVPLRSPRQPEDATRSDAQNTSTR